MEQVETLANGGVPISFEALTELLVAKALATTFQPGPIQGQVGSQRMSETAAATNAADTCPDCNLPLANEAGEWSCSCRYNDVA